MKTLASVAAIFFGLTLTVPAPAQQSGKQDMKDAGAETKDAAKDTGKGIEKGTKRTGRAVKNGSKRATHGAASGTEKGADKVREKTK